MGVHSPRICQPMISLHDALLSHEVLCGHTSLHTTEINAMVIPQPAAALVRLAQVLPEGRFLRIMGGLRPGFAASTDGGHCRAFTTPKSAIN